MHAVQIHTNVIGGMTMMEPASDLAIAVAIASSFYEQPIAQDIACIGEIGQSQPACMTTAFLCVTCSQRILHYMLMQLVLLMQQSAVRTVTGMSDTWLI